jgi:hypothetical protein
MIKKMSMCVIKDYDFLKYFLQWVFKNKDFFADLKFVKI